MFKSCRVLVKKRIIKFWKVIYKTGACSEVRDKCDWLTNHIIRTLGIPHADIPTRGKENSQKKRNHVYGRGNNSSLIIAVHELIISVCDGTLIDLTFRKPII